MGDIDKQGKSEGFDSCDWPSNLTQIGFKSSIFQPVWPWNLMDDPKNKRAPLLCYFKLFASFCSHWWIQTGFTVWKRLIWVKIDDFFSRVTLNNSPEGYELWHPHNWPVTTTNHLPQHLANYLGHLGVCVCLNIIAPSIPLTDRIMCIVLQF